MLVAGAGDDGSSHLREAIVRVTSESLSSLLSHVLSSLLPASSSVQPLVQVSVVVMHVARGRVVVRALPTILQVHALGPVHVGCCAKSAIDEILFSEVRDSPRKRPVRMQAGVLFL